MIASKSSSPLDYSPSFQNIFPLCIPRPSDTKDQTPYPSGSKPSRKPVGLRQSNKVATDIFSLNRDPKWEQGGPVQAISHSQYAARTSAPRHVSARSSSASWDRDADRLLIDARSRGMNWGPIQQAYFPNKSANACRKRHERLMSKQNNALCSGEREERIAHSYVALRKETWAPIAAQTGEKWHVIEQKILSQGLRNIQLSARAYARRMVARSGGAVRSYADSAVSGIDDLISTRSSSASWDLEADRLLIDARSRDMNWGPIQQAYFPNKSANACRKRHERLMSKENTALCSSEREERIAHSYVALRKETWAPIAAQTGEKWHVVEQKLFQPGRAPAVQLHPNRHDDGIEVSTDEEQAKSKITAILPLPTAPEVSPARPEDPTLRLSLSNNVPSDGLDWKDQKNHVIRSPGSDRTVSTFSPIDSSSSGDDGCLLTRSERKRVLLDRLMRYFYSIFSVFPSPGPYIQEHGAGKGTSTCQTSGDHRHSHQSQSPAHYCNSTSSIVGKRQAEDDNEDGCNRKRPLLKLNDLADDQSKRLACPFFKKDPRQYQGGSRSCSGPGWFTVHRIKEHIYRSHTLPISCPRCNEVFQTDRLKDEHIQAVERCEPRDPVRDIEGIDSTQKERLRSRKKTDKHKTEAEKWDDIYLILFPDTDSICIPSPYYEYSNLTDPSYLLSPNQEFVRYEQFLRRELPSRVRLQLEVRIEERLNPVEEGLRSELVEIVREMQLQLFEIYKSSRTTGSHVIDTATQVDGNTETYDKEASSFGEGQDTQIWSIEDQLQPFYQPPHVENFNLFDDFDGLFFNFPEMQSDSIAVDSGYGSLPSVNSGELEEHGNDPDR